MHPSESRKTDAELPIRRLIGVSSAMRRLREQLAIYAPTDMPIVFLGEPGTGKSLCAQVTWECMGREGPVEELNCAALPDDLLESQIFGHERGAFTGATHRVGGAVARAHGGVLFLDEIGELSSRAQAKLLEVLDTGEYLPLGSERKLRSSFRLLAATNADLEHLVELGKFRRDLYDRLGIVHLWLPPLRERREDIPVLTRHLLESSERLEDGHPRHATEETLRFLQARSWKDENIRRLKNVAEGAAVEAQGESHIHVTHIRKVLALRSQGLRYMRRSHMGDESPAHSSLVLASEAKERWPTWEEIELEAKCYKIRALLAALERAGGSRQRAAAELEMPEATFYRYLKKAENLGLTEPRQRTRNREN